MAKQHVYFPKIRKKKKEKGKKGKKQQLGE